MKLLFIFLIMGIVFYLSGLYTKKHPYSEIKRSLTQSYKAIAREAVIRYADKTSKALRILGAFYIVLAFVQYLIGNPEFSLTALFVPLIPFIVYIYYFRKILTGKVAVVPMILVTLSIIAPCLFIGISYIDVSVTVDNEKISISGLYGEKIPLNQLSDVFLADTLPNIGIHTNGISTGTVNKGYFYSKSLRKNVKLLLHSNTKPYIYIITADKKYVIVNFRKREKIRQVYNQLKQLTENE